MLLASRLQPTVLYLTSSRNDDMPCVLLPTRNVLCPLLSMSLHMGEKRMIDKRRGNSKATMQRCRGNDTEWGQQGLAWCYVPDALCQQSEILVPIDKMR